MTKQNSLRLPMFVLVAFAIFGMTANANAERTQSADDEKALSIIKARSPAAKELDMADLLRLRILWKNVLEKSAVYQPLQRKYGANAIDLQIPHLTALEQVFSYNYRRTLPSMTYSPMQTDTFDPPSSWSDYRGPDYPGKGFYKPSSLGGYEQSLSAHEAWALTGSLKDKADKLIVYYSSFKKSRSTINGQKPETLDSDASPHDDDRQGLVNLAGEKSVEELESFGAKVSSALRNEQWWFSNDG